MNKLNYKALMISCLIVVMMVGNVHSQKNKERGNKGEEDIAIGIISGPIQLYQGMCKFKLSAYPDKEFYMGQGAMGVLIMAADLGKKYGVRHKLVYQNKEGKNVVKNIEIYDKDKFDKIK